MGSKRDFLHFVDERTVGYSAASAVYNVVRGIDLWISNARARILNSKGSSKCIDFKHLAIKAKLSKSWKSICSLTGEMLSFMKFHWSWNCSPWFWQWFLEWFSNDLEMELDGIGTSHKFQLEVYGGLETKMTQLAREKNRSLASLKESPRKRPGILDGDCQWHPAVDFNASWSETFGVSKPTWNGDFYGGSPATARHIHDKSRHNIIIYIYINIII